MTNLQLSWAWPVAVAFLLSGTGLAQSHAATSGDGHTDQGSQPIGPAVTGGPGSQPENCDMWRETLREQPGHPAPHAILAILPTFSRGAPCQVLVQGGCPGSLVRLDFEACQPHGLLPVGWARFDGAGQARIGLGTGARPQGTLLAWLGGSHNSWWPGPRLSLGSVPSAQVLTPQERPVQSGELVITEIMKDPSAVSDTAGEWIELFNTTWMRQDIEGFTLSDDAGGGTVLSNAGNRVWVFGRGYRVLARNADSGVNGGISGAHDYSSFSLRNGADQVILARPDGTVVDRVSYDDGIDWPDVNGASLQLNPDINSAYNNDNGANWCSSFSTYGLGDLGTPGLANEDC